MTETTQPSARSSGPPLGGTHGEWRYRLLHFHLPLAVVSGAAMFLFMALPSFDVSGYSHARPSRAVFAQHQGEGGSMGHGAEHAGRRDHGAGHHGPRSHGGHNAANTAPTDHGHEQAESGHAARTPGGRERRQFNRQLTFATGYVATVLLALTLVIGTANLLLGRRNPVSNYLRRDVGAWTAIFGAVHTIFA